MQYSTIRNERLQHRSSYCGTLSDQNNQHYIYIMAAEIWLSCLREESMGDEYLQCYNEKH